MAVALPPTPRSISFPHDILHDHIDDHRRSPRMEHAPQRTSLPSISSLFQAVKDHPDNVSSFHDHHRKHSGASSGRGPSSPSRPGIMGSPRSLPPPTPPLLGPSSFDFHARQHSPGNTSPSSTAASHNGYAAPTPTTTDPESYAQPRSAYPPIPEPGQWLTARPPRSPAQASVDTPRSSTSSYPDPLSADARYSNLADQRPLPTNFPPVPGQASSLPPIDPTMSPAQASAPPPPPPPPQAWQHHHYYPPANPPAYPPPADRYVCPTCQKPFSRPSSLKIHTYSHTGEKPFKCKHEGCNKYFSVRSNMKRHEKGCHGGDSASATSNSPRA